MADVDLRGPLPTGLTALEASAGTGKTFTLTALAVRFVAELGVPASGLCLVSFTEAATAELRGRVRDRLVEAVAHLAAGAPDTDDPVLAALADGADPDELARRLGHLRAAVAEFDAATITTIHGFCSRVLAGAGTGVADARVSPVDHDVDEIVNDVYLARFAVEGPGAVTPSGLLQAVRLSLAMPDAVLFRPDLLPEPVTGTAKQRDQRKRIDAHEAADLVDRCRERIVADRRAHRRRTFDGLLADARSLLASADGPAIVAALRERYRVVLIDEFQDTDRVQWDIFRRAFVDPAGGVPVTTVLVGDPKQAIYRFRAAELSAYLDARAAASSVATLGTNFRSDDALLRGLERLFAGYHFGDDAVRFHPVAAADGHRGSRLSGAGGAPVELRCVPTPDGPIATPRARRIVRRDVVTAVLDLLGDPQVRIDGERVRPDDIAILTRSNADATALALDLGAAGVPAATASSNSVLDSPAAQQWEVLLRALERPAAPGTARAAALGWFLGWEPAEVDALDDVGLGRLHDVLREWSLTLARHGLARLLASAREHGLHGRLLSRRGGERDLTDVDHVAELLQTLTGGRPTSASALLQLMADVVEGRGDEAVAPELLARRIDRDDEAVQVLTIHKSKGLEFPIVLCPYLWTAKPGRNGVPHAQVGGRRLLDTTWVAGSKPVALNRAIRDGDRAELDGEARRLLYVAATRARHRLVMWWAPLGRGASQLGELLAHALGAEQPPTSIDQVRALHDDERITVSEVRTGRPRAAEPVTAGDRPELVVAEAVRRLDEAWRIWSFSGLKATAEERHLEAVVTGDAPDPSPGAGTVSGGTDEPSGETPVPEIGAPVVTRLADAPGGTSFGTLVHGVLELVDFTSETVRDDLVTACAEALRFRPSRIAADDLADGLLDAIHAPLGGPLGTTRLRDLARADRLDELSFDLPLGRLRADRIGAVLADHLAPDDPLVAWARALATNGYDVDVAGMLTGSIDLVARTGTGDDPRFWVADYKTNQLGADSGYTTAELATAMAHHDYGLQAVLYLVALHRYLRWRLPGYDPQRHLGGAAYLFVRGMDPARPADEARGVFWWRPPVAAVVAVDALVAGRGAP